MKKHRGGSADSGKNRKGTNTPEDEDAAESRRILERVARDSETIGTSSLARSTERLTRHFSGTENPQDDPVEIWGKRIGRILALIVFILLFVHLMNTYILK